ncbi:class III lanthipeptide [Alkalihalophilus marmarensis]
MKNVLSLQDLENKEEIVLHRILGSSYSLNCKVLSSISIFIC